jgi:exopolysaccharide production protein ExoQ
MPMGMQLQSEAASRQITPQYVMAPPVQLAAPSLVVQLLFAVFLIFQFPAFTYQLAMNVGTGRWTGSEVLQIATIGSEVFAILMILTSREAIGLALRCWPIWVFIAIAFASTFWSISPMRTLQSSNTSMSTMLLGLALAARVPQFQGIRLVIRTMALGCALSVAWVVMFPETAVHQATDLFQFVHAGLWRGIFSHKQGLGYFAGLTTGLLVFYNRKIFSPLVLVGAIGCGVSCLVGTKSTTGLLTALLTPGFLYLAHWSTHFAPQVRKSVFLIYALAALAIFAAYELGIFNFLIVQVLGKSTDLTGRITFWEVILTNFDNSGRTFLGGGFNAGFAADLYEMSVDNGYIDRLIEFGHLFSSVIFAIYAFIFYSAIKLVIRTPQAYAPINIFPFGIMSVILLVNITESNFMTKCLSTVLTAMAVALIVQQSGIGRAGRARSG